MAIVVFLLALAFAASPFFSDFSGFDPTQYPIPQEDPPVQPAGWAFSIWGPIYLWLSIGTGYGVWRRREAGTWADHRPALAVSLAVGTIWLAVAVASPVWATVLIWAMLLAAIWAFVKTPQGDIAFSRGPIGLYAGWLTAASSVSIGLLMAGYGLLGQVPAAWGALILALAIGGIVAHKRPSVAYPTGIAWAAIGVAAQNWGTLWGLTGLALVGAGLMAFLAVKGLRALTP